MPDSGSVAFSDEVAPRFVVDWEHRVIGGAVLRMDAMTKMRTSNDSVALNPPVGGQ
jgi:hypothetical protein